MGRTELQMLQRTPGLCKADTMIVERRLFGRLLTNPLTRANEKPVQRHGLIGRSSCFPGE